MELFARVAHETQAAVIVVTHDHRSLDVFDTHYEMEDGRLRLTKAAHSSRTYRNEQNEPIEERRSPTEYLTDAIICLRLSISLRLQGEMYSFSRTGSCSWKTLACQHHA